MSELKYWLWLAGLGGLRPRTKVLLTERFGSPRQAYFAQAGEYDGLELSPRERDGLAQKDLRPAERIMELCERKNIQIVTLQDADYPARLAGIYDPPSVLFVRGRLPAVDELASVAVVGTRKATPYGIRMATKLGSELTKLGGVVVSGLTQGIDAAAARAALLAGGPCIGVLGTAIDGVWGGELATDVSCAGALVSEYPPGAESYASYFRARNRITSGLSLAAVIVEAPVGSGALLFADEASEQGRQVFVVPSNADSVAGAGSNALMLDGATPVSSGRELLEYFPGFAIKRENAGVSPEPCPPEEADVEPVDKKVIDNGKPLSYIDLKEQLNGLTETQLKVVSVITERSMHVDDIIERSKLPTASVLAELTMLQIKGCVLQETGKRFSLNITEK